MLFTQLLHIHKKQAASLPQLAPTLDSVPVGSSVRIHALRQGAGDSVRHLQAYGLLPGRTVRILTHRPLTIIQIEQTELALEHSVAKLVLVDLS